MNSKLLDDCYDFSSLDWRLLERINGKKKVPAIFVGVARFFYFFIRSVKLTCSNDWLSAMKSSKGKALFLVGTKNNENTLLPIALRLENYNYKVMGYHTWRGQCERLPEVFFYLFGMLFIHRYLITYLFHANVYQRWAMRIRLDQYLVGCGAGLFWNIYLRLSRPKVLIVSNDHNVWTRALLKAAKELNIQSIFVPHAPTGKKPPPLIVDYAFFDGQSQSSMYEIPDNAVVVDVGAVRYEAVIKGRGVHNRSGAGVVVAFNKIDTIPFVESVLGGLMRAGFMRVYVRPHPADGMRFDLLKRICSKYECIYSDPSVTFIEECFDAKYVLAGISGIHTDALMCGMIPLSTREWYSEDYYNYESNGLIHLFENLEGVTAEACSLVQVNKRSLVFLNAHLGAPEAMPSKRIAEYIKDILAFKEPVDD